MAKRASVILVNYNGMPHLDACISSLLKQSYTNFEVIFVDNNSSDGSLDYARKKFPNLTFVINDKNLGYAGGINSGLTHATGEYIAPLNIDTEVAPNWLSAMVAFLDDNPQAGAVTPKVLLFDDRTKINAMGLNIHITGLGFCRSLDREDDISIIPENVPGVSGCSYLIKREILEEMGGAPQECFMGNDDVIVSWLLRLMGYEIYCVPEAVVYHKYKLRMNPDKLYSLEKNRQALLLYSLKPSTIVVYFPIIAAVEVLIIGYALLRGKAYLKAKFGALWSLVKDRKYISEKRVQIQKIRRISDFRLFKNLKLTLEWGQVFHTVDW
jgi:GT2 family glycosyltransferase